MLKVLVGDIFESKAQTWVNTVNTIGVMGKGIALGFRERFPEMYRDYVSQCQKGLVKLGEPYLYRRAIPPWIINFPTKSHWRSVARLEDIERGLDYLKRRYVEWGVHSLAVPPLGCGEGQLEWRVVGRTLIRHLREFDIPVDLYAPHGTPDSELDPTSPSIASTTQRSRVPASWVALVDALARLHAQKYRHPIGRIGFQKLAYFATVLGIPTGLRFDRGSYGPFAPDVKRLSVALVNNGLLVEEQFGRMFLLHPGPTSSDALAEFHEELQQWNPIIERLVDLFARITTRQAEIAASVHYASRMLERRDGTQLSEAEVLAEVMRWKMRRRPPLHEGEVARTVRALNLIGLVQLKASRELPLPAEASLAS